MQLDESIVKAIVQYFESRAEVQIYNAIIQSVQREQQKAQAAQVVEEEKQG